MNDKNKTLSEGDICPANRFQSFDIYTLEILRKAIIHSIKTGLFKEKEDKDLGDLKRVWAELDDELRRKRINNQKKEDKNLQSH